MRDASGAGAGLQYRRRSPGKASHDATRRPRKARRADLCLFLLAVVASAGVAGADVRETRDDAGRSNACAQLSVLQAGRERLPRDGAIALDRRPFRLRFRGEGDAPSVAAMLAPALNEWLSARDRPRVWTGKGELMAHLPADLITTDEFQLMTGPGSRRAYAAVMGDGYPALLEALIRRRPELDTALSVTRTAFEPGDRGGHSLAVDTIDGRPVTETRMRELYLTAVATIDEYSPHDAPHAPLHGLLIETDWDVCVLRFPEAGDA